MKIYLTIVVLAVILLLADAMPPGGGKKDKKGKKGKKDKGRDRGRPGGRHEDPGRGGPGGHRDQGGPGGHRDQGPQGGHQDQGPQGGHHDQGGPGGHHDQGGHGQDPRWTGPGAGDPGRGGHHDPGRPGQDPYDPTGRPDPGHGGGRDRPGYRDPRCDNLNCDKPNRDTYVCGSDGESYRSECYLIRDICKGKVAGDVVVVAQGRCQHPAEAGEPHQGPGRYTPGHHRGPGGKTPRGHHGPGGRTPHGHHGPGGRTPHDHHHHHHGPGGKTPGGGKHPGGHTPGHHHGHWPDWRDWLPRECWDYMPPDDMMTTTPMPDESSVPDYFPDGPVCTATCPVATPLGPLQEVCGTNGRTYESACILEFVACVTDDNFLAVAHDGQCL